MLITKWTMSNTKINEEAPNDISGIASQKISNEQK